MPGPLDPDAVTLAKQGLTIAEIAATTGMPHNSIVGMLVEANVEPVSAAHKLRAFDALLQRGLGLTVRTEALSSGEIVQLLKQLPPDSAALQQYLEAAMPERFRDERPALAVQYVVNLPAVSQDAQSWLSDIGRGQGRIASTQGGRVGQLASEGQAGGREVGGVMSVDGGSVPDPVAVPKPLPPTPLRLPEKNKKQPG